jgi:hypothetical protein
MLCCLGDGCGVWAGEDEEMMTRRIATGWLGNPWDSHVFVMLVAYRSSVRFTLGSPFPDGADKVMDSHHGQ